jgi:hypothetical protein
MTVERVLASGETEQNTIETDASGNLLNDTTTITNSFGQLVTSQSIDNVTYYTYKFNLHVVSVNTRNFINTLTLNNSIKLKDWVHFVKLNVLQTPSAGNINDSIINGQSSNTRWESGNGTGQELFEIITTARIDSFEIMVSNPQWGAGWCIYEDDVLVYKDVVNTGSGNIPQRAKFYYPLNINNDNLPSKLLPIENQIGQGWRLIRQLPGGMPKWFPGDTNFSEINNDDELLFTTGDRSRWFITTRFEMCGTIKQGSFTPIKAYPNVNGYRWFRSSHTGPDPIIVLRINNVNVRMYSEDENTGALGDIHSSGMYVYARPTTLTITKLSPIISQIGSEWELIRHIPGGSPKWFPGDTNFSEINNDDELLFTTGDCSLWFITTRFDVCGTTFTTRIITAIDSNFGQTQLQIHNRVHGHDPIILIRNNDNINVRRMYVEDGFTGDLNDIHSSGMYVYSRPKQRYYGQYKQITTYYDGVTSPTETYVNALTSTYSIDGDGSTVEIVTNYNNEVINIITTSIPDTENNITIVNEDKQTNTETITKIDNNAT